MPRVQYQLGDNRRQILKSTSNIFFRTRDEAVTYRKTLDSLYNVCPIMRLMANGYIGPVEVFAGCNLFHDLKIAFFMSRPRVTRGAFFCDRFIRSAKIKIEVWNYNNAATRRTKPINIYLYEYYETNDVTAYARP